MVRVSGTHDTAIDRRQGSRWTIRVRPFHVVGASIADAFLSMYIFESTCMIQVRAQGGGELVTVPQPILDGAKRMQKEVTRGLGSALVGPGLLRRLASAEPRCRDW